MVVSGGGYVLYKLQPILALSPVALNALVVIGTVTAIGASLVSIAQIDIKRSLSHSTSAYMGLVFLAVGLQQGGVALMLLFTHAIAKALLFMSAGSIIYTTSTQDLTEMGGLWSRMPATTTAFVVGSAGMVTLLPLGSFWAMLTWAEGFWVISPWVVGVLLIVNGLTALNLTRVFRLVFWGEPQPKTRRAPEVAWPMALPMVSLTVMNLLVPLMLQQWQLLPTSWEMLNWLAVSLLVVSASLGVAIGSTVYLHKAWSRSVQPQWRLVQDLLGYDFYIDQLYRVTVVFGVNLVSQISAWVDRYILDGVVNLVGLATIFSGESLKYTISGQSQGYLLTILVGVSLLGLFISWSLGYIFFNF
jgi:NAD(P)H-quinone oxidoreductase subunit 5